MKVCRLVFLSVGLLATACRPLAGTSPRLADRAIIAEPLPAVPPALAEQSAAAFAVARVPPRDLADLGRRYLGPGPAQPQATVAAVPPALDSVASFWVKDHDTGQARTVEARLVYQSETSNLWLQLGESVSSERLRAAAQRLDHGIIPADRALYGQERAVGLDGDSRINILHARGLGSTVFGYYAAADEYDRALNPFSNERKLLTVSLDNAPIGSDAYYQVVAHELAHMIHWNVEQNEEAWLEEGLAELAVVANGLPLPGVVAAFAAQPDLQLNDFSQLAADSDAHYGASSLMAGYFYERFGPEATRALFQAEADGVAAFDQVLPAWGGPAFDDFFADWTVANYLQGAGRGQGVFRYQDQALPPLALAADLARFPAEGEGSVHQFAADYLRLRHDRPLTLRFQGRDQVPLVPAWPHSGRFFWGTYPADNADMSLTGAFDLSGLEAATLTFWSWYDIEAGWDYAYVAVSSDEGQSWQPLETIYTTQANPQGNNLGLGLTGYSGRGSGPQWAQQQADLTPFAGRPVLLRFEYVTDQGVHLAGLLLDDFAIPELGFSDDVEGGTGPWQAAGFVRHANALPQRWQLQMILLGRDGVRLVPLPLEAGSTGEWEVPLSPAFPEAVIVVSGLTRATTMPASYRYQIAEP